MKLAEALLLRADIQKKLASLQSRAQKYVVVQEGEQPAESPQELLRQVDLVAEEFRKIVFAINRANLKHTVKSGESITEALATRDALVLRHRILLSVVEACVRPADRYSKKKFVGSLQSTFQSCSLRSTTSPNAFAT
jgi:hypothetical protein